MLLSLHQTTHCFSFCAQGNQDHTNGWFSASAKIVQKCKCVHPEPFLKPCPLVILLCLSVKYEAPHNISMSWLKNNLKLSWIAAEDYPALTEIRFRRAERPSESWEYVRKTLLPNFTESAAVSLY